MAENSRPRGIRYYKYMTEQALWVHVRNGDKKSLENAQENYNKYVAFGGKVSFETLKHRAFYK